MAWIMRRAMHITGPESLSCAANVFLGQTEAPLLVRPYISGMSLSELMALMTGGFATIAAGVMAVYISMLGQGDPEKSVSVARHLLTASLMSAPAALVMAKIMVPPRRLPALEEAATVEVPRETSGLLDAATHGATQGMTLAINVLAMLVAFIALIAILDAGLIAVGRMQFAAPAVRAMGLEQLDLKGLFGLLFSPVAFVLGVDRPDCRKFGSILGTAMATNEMVAYGSLAEMVKQSAMSPRSLTMAIYSICGFANFSSIGIQIGGIGAMAPDRRADLVRLAPRAMLGGAMASWCTGCIAGVLV
jgi:CNT family concentrative nucleoside transporter